MKNVLLDGAQLIVAASLLDVWLRRFNKSSAFRGGSSQTMRQEFASYGLPAWSVNVIGSLKVVCALALIAGIWVTSLALPVAALVSVLMAGALAMHLKINDPLKKSLPAIGVLALSLFVSIGRL